MTETNPKLCFLTDKIISMDSVQQVPVVGHQGYIWTAGPGDTQWKLDWVPTPNVYSPPVLHPGVHVSYFFLRPDHLELTGYFIGKNGVHFKNITRFSGCSYLFLVDNRIEIWGQAHAIQKAFRMIRKHIDHVVSKIKKVQPGFDHLPINLRPPVLERQEDRS